MIIFYSKKTKDILGTVDGFSKDTGLEMGFSNIPQVDIGRVNICLGHKLEQWARDFEDSRKAEMDIKKYKFDGKKFSHRTKKDLNDEQKKSDNAMEEAQIRFETKQRIKQALLNDVLTTEEKIDLLLEYLFE